MSNKNEQFLLIIKQYWVLTCAGDIKKKYKTSSLRSLRVLQPGQGKEKRYLGRGICSERPDTWPLVVR